MTGIDVVRIECTHSFTVYPKGYSGANNNDPVWCVARYCYVDGSEKSFTATGLNLPCQKNMTFGLIGTWEEREKYGRSFQVTTYDVVLPTSEKGVVSYLKSLRIGIGASKGKRIYAKFKERIWDVLEDAPHRLTEVPGISERLVERLVDKLAETRIDRELISLFSGVYEMTAYRLAALKNTLGKDVVQVLSQDPYTMCLVQGFTFRTADLLAKKLAFSPYGKSRISACIGFVLDEAAASGHTCLPKDQFKKNLSRELDQSWGQGIVVPDENLKAAINEACLAKQIVSSADMIYSRFRYEQEVSVAENVQRMIRTPADSIEGNAIESAINAFEKDAGISLAEAQKKAVHNVFLHQMVIITGGPGTGKTTVTNAILSVHKCVFGESSSPLLMAPTGRAARRMTEATGLPADTIHSMVGYRPGGSKIEISDSEDSPEVRKLQGNLIIVDEVSMCDLEITSILLNQVPDHAKVVFVGDTDQLPSVGCGNVLYELIRSKKVPVSRLDTIFRQAGGSPIVANAAKIREGDSDLICENGFLIYKEASALDVFKRACSLYKASVKAQGLDNVVLLCPYRDKSEINVEVFNRNLQHIINPPISENELMMKRSHGISFYAHDKVMQTRNTEIARNGDVGVVRRIERVIDPEDPSEWITQAVIEFNGDGKEHCYSSTAIRDLDLAYCSSVHKSQGAEYKTVIVVLSQQHSALLRRNIVYTAITRAKENVAIITEDAPPGQSALDIAIHNNQTDRRYSLLADRIHAAIVSEKPGNII